MEEKSYLFFINRDVENVLDDPVLQIKSLDPSFVIREKVHLGNLNRTGYGIQVFIKDSKQESKILGFMKLTGIKCCLFIESDVACVLNVNSNEQSDYLNVKYHDNNTKEDDISCYNIHIEDSGMVGNVLFVILAGVRNRHPELNSITNGKFIIKF